MRPKATTRQGAYGYVGIRFRSPSRGLWKPGRRLACTGQPPAAQLCGQLAGVRQTRFLTAEPEGQQSRESAAVSWLFDAFRSPCVDLAPRKPAQSRGGLGRELAARTQPCLSNGDSGPFLCNVSVLSCLPSERPARAPGRKSAAQLEMNVPPCRFSLWKPSICSHSSKSSCNRRTRRKEAPCTARQSFCFWSAVLIPRLPLASTTARPSCLY